MKLSRFQQALLDTDPSAFARQVLDELGLPSTPLQPADGWSNQVWLAPKHVMHLSSGRFRDAYAHEVSVLNMLPESVPHATAIAHGRVGDREWIVLERMEGEALIRVWDRMAESQRRVAVREIADTLRSLHSIPLPEGFANPWLSYAFSTEGPIRDAYHAPPKQYPRFLKAAAQVPGVDRGTLDELEKYLSSRMYAFEHEREVLIHTDTHFGNWLWDGERITALLDFEGSRQGPADLELDTILRFAREPQSYCAPGEQTPLTSQSLTGLPAQLAKEYPELFSHPHLKARLEVYDALWQLVQLLHFPPGSGPPDPWGHLKSLLEGDLSSSFEL